MTAVAVRQSGGANIVSIPKAIVKTLGLQVGSKLDLSIVDNRIVLTPIEDEQSLEELLANSPRECFQVTDEDREWIDAIHTDKEI
ncbi:AbrB/MazE/SpoVT family DNA-binding domain-containing protein [Porticoccus sp. W117]|uniref:AbrB/MazE/SpoVT family DNA-binding domain-containing protein n=1 Tax=Porticoccus sp. W117 TaxID=3054777 RepID=UPI002596684E|nr:AbrB/MazE/SpoVT family DNA-binding domain-containing protein [Porticoccus sp. W117]MDM3870039.1 AbrB/MazE/SpoVT family DNA-binding domain-containing protein [Porticoccus sp. W117]